QSFAGLVPKDDPFFSVYSEHSSRRTLKQICKQRHDNLPEDGNCLTQPYIWNDIQLLLKMQVTALSYEERA
ncbi:MAG: hypothetical protein AAB319_03945, partial [Pseudomonadota bacterium]